jgi:hypothetical protein
LQNGKGKAHGGFSLSVQVVGAVKLGLHILGDSSIKSGFPR